MGVVAIRDEMEAFLSMLMGYPVDVDNLSLATKRMAVQYQDLARTSQKEEGSLDDRRVGLRSHWLLKLSAFVCVIGFSGSLLILLPVSSLRATGGVCLSLAIVALILMIHASRSAERWNAAEIREVEGALGALRARREAALADLMKAVGGDLERVHQQKVRPTVEYRETIRDVTVDINRLYDTIKTHGLAVPYRCPSCGGTLKLVGDRRFEKCPYCGSDVDVRILMDLVSALK